MLIFHPILRRSLLHWADYSRYWASKRKILHHHLLRLANSAWWGRLAYKEAVSRGKGVPSSGRYFRKHCDKDSLSVSLFCTRSPIIQSVSLLRILKFIVRGHPSWLGWHKIRKLISFFDCERLSTTFEIYFFVICAILWNSIENYHSDLICGIALKLYTLFDVL